MNMTNENTPVTETPKPRSRLNRNRLVTAAGLIALAGLTFTAGRATAHGGWGWGWGHGGGYGRHMGEHGGRGGMGMRGEGGWMMGRVDSALDSVGATAEQKQKIRSQLEALRPEMMAMRDSQRTLRSDFEKLLRADQPDRAAIEKLRSERMAQMDAASRRMSEALITASETLSPQQRQQLLDRMQRRWRG
jgi:periplasmic protein CpxP/Spy